MNNISSIEYCCGCGNCTFVCPNGCLKIKRNREGFYVADLDSNACLSCGLCLQSCPLYEPERNINQGNQSVFAAVSKDTDTYQKSSSGGAFSAIAEIVLANGGGSMCMWI